MTEKILLVDDEPNVLSAYSRTLRRQFSLATASSGAEALELMRNEGPFAVIVSDMRMPEMDGLELLTRVKQDYQDTVRIMLTGNADQQTAIDAVNQGDVFRFLNKPCPPEAMANTLNLAIKQYQLINAEKELLENTLKGCIEALSEVLQLTNPEVFGRTTKIKNLMTSCAEKLQLENLWELESIAMLCQLGYVALPNDLVARASNTTALNREESSQFNQHARLASDLIGKIPRMEGIAASIRYQNNPFDGSGLSLDGVKGEQLPIGARLLKVILDFDNFERNGLDTELALAKLQSNADLYDPNVLSALAKTLAISSEKQIREVSVAALDTHMSLAQDIHTHNGMLLACKGQPVTESLSERLSNFWRNNQINEKINVML
ncbi:MAG: response regulator [Pseudomonadales bacterium]